MESFKGHGDHRQRSMLIDYLHGNVSSPDVEVTLALLSPIIFEKQRSAKRGKIRRTRLLSCEETFE